MTAPHGRYHRCLGTLTLETLDALPDYVIDDVRFKDPFNDVHGADAMHRVFRHMFDNVGNVRFTVHRAVLNGDTCLMDWRFEGLLRSKPWVFEGASVVTFATDGRVAEHIDHWDAASAFYERLPILGSLLGWIRGRLTVR